MKLVTGLSYHSDHIRGPTPQYSYWLVMCILSPGDDISSCHFLRFDCAVKENSYFFIITSLGLALLIQEYPEHVESYTMYGSA